MKHTKLTTAQVEMIRIAYTKKSLSIAEMARRLNVSPRTIGRVIDSLDMARPTARLKGEAYNVMQTLEKNGVKPEFLPHFFATLRMMGMQAIYQDGKTVQFKHPVTPVSNERIVGLCKDMTEDEWQAMLSEIVTARVAKAHNTHVQTAMLNIEKKVDKNAQ